MITEGTRYRVSQQVFLAHPVYGLLHTVYLSHYWVNKTYKKLECIFGIYTYTGFKLNLPKHNVKVHIYEINLT